MRFTCALDVVDHYKGEELPDFALALLLGVRRQCINNEVREAVLKQRDALAHMNIIDVDEHGHVLGTIGEQGPDFR